jgi:hypothetical protein
MVRYVDDFVILCRTEDEAQAALRQDAAWVTANSPTLHPRQTRAGDRRQPGQGFDFLGYRFEAGRRLVRKKSLKAPESPPSRRRGRGEEPDNPQLGRQPRMDHCRPQPDGAGVVWLLQTCHTSPDRRH